MATCAHRPAATAAFQDGLGPNRRTDRGVVCSLFGSNDASSHRAQITHARRWLRGPIVGSDRVADSDIGGVGVDELGGIDAEDVTAPPGWVATAAPVCARREPMDLRDADRYATLRQQRNQLSGGVYILCSAMTSRRRHWWDTRRRCLTCFAAWPATRS